jgi:hypothetical protein
VSRTGRGLALLVALATPLASCGDDGYGDVAVIGAVADGAAGVSVSVAACNSDPAPEATVVREGADTVTVSARADDSSDDDCADVAVLCLDAPLGDRELVDASTGRAVPVETFQLSEELCPGA